METNLSKAPTVDKAQVQAPTIHFSSSAEQALSLIIENDFTLAGKYFRILISGKGCDGFTYSTGFTDLDENDFLIPSGPSHQVLMDPFTAFYIQNAQVDYIQELPSGNEGFVVINKAQKDHNGKFWREASGQTPPILP